MIVKVLELSHFVLHLVVLGKVIHDVYHFILFKIVVVGACLLAAVCQQRCRARRVCETGKRRRRRVLIRRG